MIRSRIGPAVTAAQLQSKSHVCAATARGRVQSGTMDFLGALFARGAGAPLAFGANILLARLLGPQHFGLYISLLSAGLVAGAVAAYGVGPVLTREIAAKRIAPSVIVTWALRLTGGLAVAAMIVLLVWLTVGKAAGAPPSTWLERTAALLLVPASVGMIAVSGVLGGVSLVSKSTSLANLWKNGIILLGAGGLILIGANKVAYALWLQVASTVVAVVIGVQWARVGIGQRLSDGDDTQIPRQNSLDKGLRRDWRRAAGHFFAMSAAMMVLGRLDVLIVNAVAGATEAGLFGAAARTGQFAAMAGLVWVAWLQPRLSRDYEDGDTRSLQQRMAKSLAGSLGMTAVLVLGGWILAPWIMALMGKGFEGSIMPFRYLVAAYLIWSVSVPYHVLLSMTGRESAVARIWWAQVGITVVASIPLAHSYGALGGAWAWAGGLVVGSVLTTGVGRSWFRSLRSI